MDDKWKMNLVQQNQASAQSGFTSEMRGPVDFRHDIQNVELYIDVTFDLEGVRGPYFTETSQMT